MLNGSLFSSSDYSRYRFEYPEVFFHPLRTYMGPMIGSSPLRMLDLGCGTGLVTESFLEGFSIPTEAVLVDVDAAMLDEARKRFEGMNEVAIEEGSAEKIPFGAHYFDFVLIGSAWHWMNPEMAMEEIGRVLKPGGLVFIFEYQFPKTLECPPLNDWIRMKFNSEWKPLSQIPRGSLKELTECWRRHSEFSQVLATTTTRERTHGASELAGVIVSQSRYQHYLQSLSEEQRAIHEVRLEAELGKWMNEGGVKFLYSYEGFAFKKRA